MDRTLQQYKPPQQPIKNKTNESLKNAPKNFKAKLVRLENESNSCISGSILEENSCISSRTIDSLTQSYSNSQVSEAVINKTESNNNNHNNSKGLFDRFLKNYTSSSSIQDEPDLSFVSSQGKNTSSDY